MHIPRIYSRLSLISITLLSLAVNACSGPVTPGDSMSASGTESDGETDSESESGDGGTTGGASDAGSGGEFESGDGEDSDGDSETGEPVDDPPIAVRCVDLDLSPEKAIQTDAMGDEMVWTTAFDEQADTLSLARAGACGEDCSFYDEILFINVTTDSVPVCDTLAIAYASRRVDDPVEGELVYELDASGLAYVQDWKPAEWVSGLIEIGQGEDAITLMFHTSTSG